MISNIGQLALGLVAGMGLGLFFFIGLWQTTRAAVRVRRPFPLLAASFCVRAAVVTAGFHFSAGGMPDRFAACLVGFVAARQVVLWMFGRVGGFPADSAPAS